MNFIWSQTYCLIPKIVTHARQTQKSMYVPLCVIVCVLRSFKCVLDTLCYDSILDQVT